MESKAEKRIRRSLYALWFSLTVIGTALVFSDWRGTKRFNEMHDLQMRTLVNILKLHSEPPSALPKIWYGMNDEDSSDSPSPHREER